jgi:hypothetical protein
MLVVGAGLMTRSFVRLLQVDTGFRPDHLLVMNFSINVDLHPKYTLYYQQVLEAVRKVPGVITAGAIKDAPFQGEGERYGFLPPGLAVPPGEEPPTAPLLHVSDGYFQAIGARMVEGREFTPGDNATSPVVLVVNEAFARRWFPGERAVGKELIIWGKTRVPIVAVREAIWSLDRSQPITSISTFDDIVSGAMARPRLLTSLLGAFAGLGLLLSALGLYGVLSYLVNQRQREIGVRLALGANSVGVLRSVVGRGLGLTAIGLAVGLAGALALGRSLSGVLYGVEPTDPATFAGVTVILLGVAALASWLPARRAAEVNPAVMLRAE